MAYIGYKAEDMGFDAHMTIMWLGKLDKERSDYVKSLLKDWPYHNAVVEPIKITNFYSTPVVRVKVPEEILSLLRYLNAHGVESASEFPFNPHISLYLPGDGSTLKIPGKIILSELGLY